MFYIICAICLAVVLWKVLFVSPSLLSGVYSQPGNLAWLKMWGMYLVITLRKRGGKGGAGNSKAGYGVKATADITKLEEAQPLSPNPLAVDAVLFSGGSEDGTYLVLSAARRQESIVQCICMVLVPGLGLLQHPNHPDVALVQKEEETGWKVEGIDLQPVEPMRKWRVKYTGDMVLRGPGTVHSVVIDAVYTSDLDYFDFDGDMEPLVVARAMAREPWDRAYFNRLRAAHQNHYEQFGIVSGKLHVDQVEREFSVSVMRDHTHGSTRDWKLMHRYCLHNFTFRSGLRGFLGIVSQPGTFSFLELGYIYTPDKVKHAVQEVDLPVWNLGEGGEDPSDYGFRFKAGGEWYHIQVRVEDRAEVYFGKEWEARVVERFCRYEINGQTGWGVSEWEYRHHGGNNQNKLQ